MSRRVAGILLMSLLTVLFGLGLMRFHEAIEETVSLQIPGDPTQTVENYLRAVEAERWEEAFNVYFHPSLRMEAVRYLPELAADRPVRKSFENLQIRLIAADAERALVRAQYTLDMVLPNFQRHRQDVVLNFFLEYIEGRGWMIILIEDIPI